MHRKTAHKCSESKKDELLSLFYVNENLKILSHFLRSKRLKILHAPMFNPLADVFHWTTRKHGSVFSVLGSIYLGYNCWYFVLLCLPKFDLFRLSCLIRGSEFALVWFMSSVKKWRKVLL